jgi:hypothetical protein
MNKWFDLDSPIMVALSRLADMFFLSIMWLLCCLPVMILFMVYPLSRHELWSIQTQFLDYGFSLLALISLLLFSYAYCGLSVEAFNTRWLRFSGLLACFFSITAAGKELPALFLPMAVWVSSSLVLVRPYKAPTAMEIPENVALCLERLEKEQQDSDRLRK